MSTLEREGSLQGALTLSTSPRLKPIDIEFMRQLHTRVNLIPIIAKADTLTDEEVADFKARVSRIVTLVQYDQGPKAYDALGTLGHRPPQDPDLRGPDVRERG